ncbi:MAG: DegT/DnrJ/EryC1/StrS family aminotransferase [Actinomycetota bacterium]|nr:DegT/DnrJ/EryC1/StrS family aminotransferase [Actinomycetota bacterium]
MFLPTVSCYNNYTLDSYSDKPAILGGTSIFNEPIAFNQPTLPTYDALSAAFAAVIAGGQLTNDVNVARLEAKAAELFGRPAVAVSCCTSGLILAAKMLGLTGQVIVPSFTFFATSHSLIWNGLEPLFVDIEPDSWNIDPQAVEAAINPKVSAILAVDVFGNPSHKDALLEISARHGLPLITDSAHGIGGAYKGRPIGSFGAAEVFSLSPTKVAVAGEGGLIGADSDELADRLRIARDYGNAGDYDCRFVGLNARMPELNAVIGLASLGMLDDNVRRRNELARAYRQKLADVPGLTWQKVDPLSLSTYKDISVLIDPPAFGLGRDALASALAAEGIPTRKYYWPPAHRQSAYAGLISIAGDLTVTERISANILSLPVFSHMKETDVERVCRAVIRIHRHSALIGA